MSPEALQGQKNLAYKKLNPEKVTIPDLIIKEMCI